MSTEGRGGAGSAAPLTALPSGPTRPAPARLHLRGLTAVHSQAPPGCSGAVGRGEPAQRGGGRQPASEHSARRTTAGSAATKLPVGLNPTAWSLPRVAFRGFPVVRGLRGPGVMVSPPGPPLSLILLLLSTLEAAVLQVTAARVALCPGLVSDWTLGSRCPRPTLGAWPLPSRKQETSLPRELVTCLFCDAVWVFSYFAFFSWTLNSSSNIRKVSSSPLMYYKYFLSVSQFSILLIFLPCNFYFFIFSIFKNL